MCGLAGIDALLGIFSGLFHLISPGLKPVFRKKAFCPHGASHQTANERNRAQFRDGSSYSSRHPFKRFSIQKAQFTCVGQGNHAIALEL
jgi:hypothetical protein